MHRSLKDLISILLIDDDEEDYIITRDLIEEINHRQYTVDWVESYQKGLQIIQKKEHDVYLIDFRLNAHSGLEVIKRAVAMGCEAPLILLTGEGRIEIDELALEAGAADYLVKDSLTAERLERSIRYSIQQAQNLRKIQLLNQELEKRVEARTEALAMAIQKLEQTNNELETEIKERMMVEEALRNSQNDLELALKKEKQLNELKSRFVSLASHEFRTPLSTILSSASLIAKYTKEVQQDKRIKHISRIKSSVQNLTHILNDFLSVEKLDEGLIKSNPTLFDLNEFATQLVEDMNPETQPGQEISYQFKGESTLVYADHILLTNILINLLSNAIKYSKPHTQIDLKISAYEEHIDIRVADKGIGIPDSEQVHLFQRFFRARNATNIKGTGLGLSIVKRYIELMDGNISFESQENVGTTFIIHLPQHHEIENEKDFTH